MHFYCFFITHKQTDVSRSTVAVPRNEKPHRQRSRAHIGRSGTGEAVPIRVAAPRLGNAPPSSTRRPDVTLASAPATADGPHPMPGGSRRPWPVPCRTPPPLRPETRPGAPWTRRVARRQAARKGRDTFSGSSPHALRARTTRKTDVGRFLQPRPTSLPPLPARPRCMRLTRRKARHRGGPQSLRSKT